VPYPKLPLKKITTMGVPTVTLTDDAGRSLTCYVEHSLSLADQEYLLLLPVDTPVEIFTWKENQEDEDPIPVENEAEIKTIFALAKAVLAEHNLTLKDTAVSLTAAGEIPELGEEEGDIRNGAGPHLDDENNEELQFLASFYYQEQEYSIYIPLDPLLILTQVGPDGKPHLLSEEEMRQLEPMLPMLEDQLFDALE